MRKIRGFRLLILPAVPLLILVLRFAGNRTEARSQSADLEFTESRLGPFQEFFAGEDLSHIGWIADVDGKKQLFLDGHPAGDRYKSVWGLSHSPMGDHAAFVVQDGKSWRVVLDGKTGPKHDDVKQVTVFATVAGTTYSETYKEGERSSEPAVIFSPDGSRMAYSALDRGKWRVYLDGKAGPAFDQISTAGNLGIVFSPDSRHIAYIARQDGKWRVVVDGKQGAKYDQIALADSAAMPSTQNSAGLHFSSNSRHLAYLARRGRKQFMVLDGTPSVAYDSITAIRFSPDGSRNAYFGMSNGSWRLVVDGKPSREAYSGPGAIVFSNDGRRLAYGARDSSDHDFMVIDGVRSPVEMVSVSRDDLMFSPDGSSFAYVGETGRPGDTFVVIDGKLFPADQSVMTWSLKYSPLGNRVGYIVHQKDGYLMVVDGKPGPEYSSVRGLEFSPDGKHFAYEATSYRSPTSYLLVVDGEPKQQPGSILIIGFSPDSSHLAALLRDEKAGNRFALWLDGSCSGYYERIHWTKRSFDGNTFKCLAVRDSTLYRLTATTH